MKRPDFANIDLSLPLGAYTKAADETQAEWLTAEQIAVKTRYTANDLRGMEHLTGILHYVKMHVHPNKLPISVVDKLLNNESLITDTGTLQAIDEQLNEFLAY